MSGIEDEGRGERVSAQLVPTIAINELCIGCETIGVGAQRILLWLILFK